MSTAHISNKLKEFKKYLKDFAEYQKSGVEDIHRLRVLTREIFSLLHVEDTIYKRVKKVIKISNKIRDLDVFLENYLESLPKRYKTKLDMKSIVDSTNASRESEVEKLHAYLKSLIITQSTRYADLEEKIDFANSSELSLNQMELHKYRIYIKKVLFREQNSSTPNEKKIKLLKKIKDILGSINDNANGFTRLSEYNIEANLLSKIEEFTHKQNLKLFKEFKKSNDKYVKTLL